MKKLLFTIGLLLLTTSCFAEGKVYPADYLGNIVTPVGAGSVITASTATITTAWAALALGTTNPIAKVVLSAPIGTAYIGSTTPTNGIAWAATQGALTLDITDLGQLYWTGIAGQKLNFIVITR